MCQLPRSERSIQELQVRLNAQAAGLSEAASAMVGVAQRGAEDPQQVALSSSRLSRAYEDFVDGSLEMAGATPDQATRTQIVTELRGVSLVTSRLLLASKALLADPTGPNIKQQLTQAARYASPTHAARCDSKVL